jgi:glycosyltransferase involved in cell wall biosynthesis
MQQGILFSVVIPTHNRVGILLEALESVRRQTFEDYEVIVVDDGSTDDTARALERLAEEIEDRRLEIGGAAEPLEEKAETLKSEKLKLKYIRQENAGPGAARNLGASVARGEYLAFLDSDDLFFPRTLETYREVIEKENRPGFVAGCPFVFERKEQVDAVAKRYLQTKGFADYLESGVERRWWGVSSFVVKKSLFDQVGGFTSEFVNGEDADFVMKCGVEPGFVKVVSPFTFGYRKHEANITKAFEKNLAGARLQIRNEKTGVYPGGKSRACERWHILSRQIRPVAVAALENGRSDAAWEIYKATLGWHLALGKWKFLIGLPGAMAWRACARR